tara:strand:+ start:174 stop:365 length:192 start_codon:yes stop_codon:yes gene_type:complete
MEKERLTRYDLGKIQKLHDTFNYNCASRTHLNQQLERIGLPPNASRFEVAMRKREIEANGGRV